MIPEDKKVVYKFDDLENDTYHKREKNIKNRELIDDMDELNIAYDAYYDSIAEGYDKLHGEEQEKKLAVIKGELARNNDVHEFILPADHLLDIGCGTGISTIFFDCARRVGIDPSVKLIERAVSGASSYQVGYAEKLPFRDHEFDIIISITAIQNFYDIKKGLEEIKRVGKERFILTFLKRSEKKEFIDAAIRKLFTVITIIEEEKDVIYFCR